MSVAFLRSLHMHMVELNFKYVLSLQQLKGNLERCPTPYPKEMKNRIQHMRNLALKQLNIPNGAVRQGPDPGGGATAAPKVRLKDRVCVVLSTPLRQVRINSETSV